MEETFDLEMKVIVVGNGQVGKSSMIKRFAHGTFTDEYKKTLGVDFLEKRAYIPAVGDDVEFYIWDTAGQEYYEAITRKYYKGASACILAFSTVDRESFDAIERWKEKVEEECGPIAMILAQNKIDLIDNAEMSVGEVEHKAAKLGLTLFRMCVKDNIMVNEVFEYLAKMYFKGGYRQSQQEGPVASIAEINSRSMDKSTSMSKPFVLGSAKEKTEEQKKAKRSWGCRLL